MAKLLCPQVTFIKSGQKIKTTTATILSESNQSRKKLEKGIHCTNRDVIFCSFFLKHKVILQAGFPGGSAGKESACNAADLGSIPGLGRSPGEGKGYPFQYSCLKNPMDRGAWWATVHGVTESDTTEQLTFHNTNFIQCTDSIFLYFTK